MSEHECSCDGCRERRELEANGTSESEDCMTRGGGANGGGGQASRAGDKEVFVISYVANRAQNLLTPTSIQIDTRLPCLGYRELSYSFSTHIGHLLVLCIRGVFLNRIVPGYIKSVILVIAKCCMY